MPNIIKILLWTALAVVIILFIVWVIWTMMWIPIKKRESLNNHLDQEKQELNKIQAQKGVEWESFTKLTDEVNKLRTAFVEAKELNEKQKEANAKLQVHNDNLKSVNAQLKKQGIQEN